MILLANGEGAAGIGESARRLAAGSTALDAIEAGIRLVEADPQVRSVGIGSWPNVAGVLQLDAAIMEGTSRRTGAVGALQGFAHPISIARAVMDRLPHEILVGEGAARFAREIGGETITGRDPLADSCWREMLRRHGASELTLSERADFPLIELARAAIDPEMVRDTTVFLARDTAGNLSNGASTSGWAWKYPGRLGDTPIIGAGSYADTRHGAAACTHTGEMTIRASTARTVVLHLKAGLSLDDAVGNALDDLRDLHGGQLGTVVIHALDRHGGHKVSALNATEPIFYWLWRPDMPAPERLPAQSG
jgi:beta-aspartyl-peptidase (threonine type)